MNHLVRALMCMRGFDFIAAITFVAEIADLTRVAKPTALMAYLGLEEAITAQLTSHYRKTLDEAVLMLNGLSPRQCAVDPALHDDVINWLKQLETSDGRSPGAAYDFGRVWNELKLERK